MEHHKFFAYQTLGSKLRLSFAVLGACLALFILIKSLGAVQTTMSVTNGDKIVHALAYFSLGLAVFPAFGRIRPVFIWGLLSAYGGAIELLQGAMRLGRKADVMDAIANSLGAFFAFFVLFVLSKIWPKGVKPSI